MGGLLPTLSRMLEGTLDHLEEAYAKGSGDGEALGQDAEGQAARRALTHLPDARVGVDEAALEVLHRGGLRKGCEFAAGLLLCSVCSHNEVATHCLERGVLCLLCRLAGLHAPALRAASSQAIVSLLDRGTSGGIEPLLVEGQLASLVWLLGECGGLHRHCEDCCGADMMLRGKGLLALRGARLKWDASLGRISRRCERRLGGAAGCGVPHGPHGPARGEPSAVELAAWLLVCRADGAGLCGAMSAMRSALASERSECQLTQLPDPADGLTRAGLGLLMSTALGMGAAGEGAGEGADADDAGDGRHGLQPAKRARRLRQTCALAIAHRLRGSLRPGHPPGAARAPAVEAAAAAVPPLGAFAALSLFDFLGSASGPHGAESATAPPSPMPSPLSGGGGGSGGCGVAGGGTGMLLTVLEDVTWPRLLPAVSGSSVELH